MEEDNSKVVELISYVKDIWGILSVVSPLAGPGGLLLVPVVPNYRASAASWAVVFSVFALLLIYQALWKRRTLISCWWPVLPLVLAVVAAATYSFLLDYLPVRVLPIQYPTLTQHVVSVSYGFIFGFFTAILALLRVCRAVP